MLSMQSFLSAFICIFLMGAGKQALDPSLFLREILQHEYNGDGGVRIGKVIYSSSDVHRQSDCDCDVPKEAFFPDASPVVVVTSWKILSSLQVSADIFKISVLFHTVARSSGDGVGPGGRRIVTLQQPTDERIDYRIQRRGQSFYLIDPTLPRVGLQSLIGVMADTLAQARAAALPGSQGPGLGAETTFKWAKVELDTLLSLGARQKSSD